jgi:hypothetical protein
MTTSDRHNYSTENNMVETVQRTAVSPFEITDETGAHWALDVGKSYTTNKWLVDGKVFVFSSYWLTVPPEHFGMDIEAQIACRRAEADQRLSKAADRLKKANDELDAAEREHRLASEAIDALAERPSATSTVEQK